ncbi:unnamed protein product, partial [marine sediment metagenome]
VITVVNIRGRRARIGIAAPDDVKILRGELVESVKQPLAKHRKRKAVTT